MLEFYYAPQSRAGVIHWILEELEVDYLPRLVDIRAEGGAPESYRAIHPHKKVPAIVHDGAIIIERPAISIYLGDRFPKPELTVPVSDPRRGPYLSWMVYLGTVFDPALCAGIKGWSYASNETGFGHFKDVMAYISGTLSTQRYVLGERLTLVDLELATSLNWALHATQLVPDEPYLRDYIARVQDRPSFERAIGRRAT